MAARAYIDSNIIIYMVEGETELKAGAASAIDRCLREGGLLVTSELTVAECLTGALRRDRQVADTYLDLFDREKLLDVVDVTRSIVRRAAELGAELNLKLLDALHVATAEALGCEVFLTNDRAIRAPGGLELRDPGEVN